MWNKSSASAMGESDVGYLFSRETPSNAIFACLPRREECLMITMFAYFMKKCSGNIKAFAWGQADAALNHTLHISPSFRGYFVLRLATDYNRSVKKFESSRVIQIPYRQFAQSRSQRPTGAF